MVVVHVTSAGNLSGGIRQLLYLLEAQRDAGVRPVLCAPPRSKALAGAERLHVETRPMTFGGLRGQWKASRQLRAVVAEVGADLVHTHQNKGHNTALFATFGGPFPPVVVKRAVLYRPKFAVKFTTRRVAAIVTNSEAVRRVLASAGVAPEKVRVIVNPRALPDLAAIEGKKPALRAELALAPGAPVIGSVGNGSEDKGFQFIVEAAPRILARHPKATFVLVGPGVEKIEKRVAQLGLAERFRLPGFRADATDILGLFDLFVFPSVHKDTCPNVVLEAMSVGLPVVANNLTGIEEVLPPAENVGAVTDARDPARLADAVCALLADPERMREMGARARERIARHHRPEDKIAEVLALYREVLEREARTRRKAR